MAQDTPLIEPERVGLWAAAGFIIALLAFVLAFAGIYRSNHMIAATQLEILALNKKVEGMRKPSEMPAPMSAPATGAAPMEPPPAEQPAAQ
jgi:hypothetical protein